MRIRAVLIAAGLLIHAVPIAQAQVPPEKVMQTFTVTDPSLEMNLWASEPLFVNPTCMDIDHKGRVWVCETVNYRHLLHHQPPRRPEGDRIVILEDTTGSGKADKATTFYQSPETLAPLGIAVAKDPVGPGYKVFVCQSPDILVFEDRDGDGKADGPPKKLLSGFQGIDNDHGVHGILIGPDYRLYFSVGDQGVRGLPGKNGKTWTSNENDCQAGTIWRCDLDGKNLELVAHNFRNEYEPCVDSFGTVYVSDNDDDGNQQTRICYVMPGGNYGYHPRGPGQSHWHEEQPGVVPKILRTYFGSPAGMCVYEGSLLPEKYRGQLLHTDAGPRHVRCYNLATDGAGYTVDRQDLVTSTDTWFRPIDVCAGPDGSGYVADWYDSGVGGHNLADFTRGRIFRIAPKGNKATIPVVNLESREGLLAALASPAISVRYMAMAKLHEMKPGQAVEWLAGAAASSPDENPVLRARALWQLEEIAISQGKEAGFSLKQIMEKTLSDKAPRFRILGVRLVADLLARNQFPGADWNNSQEVVDQVLKGHEKDSSAAVRREILLALREQDTNLAKPLILELARQYEGNDRFYLEAIGIAVGKNKERRDIILADFDKQFPEWNERVADLVWELRPPQVLELLEKRLEDKNTLAAQRSRIVDILAASDDVRAGKSLLKSLLTNLPPEVQARVLEKFTMALGQQWRELRKAPELTDTIERLLAQRETRATGLSLIGVSQRDEASGKVAEIVHNSAETPAIRLAALETLGMLRSGEARATLEGIVKAADQDIALRQKAAAALAGTREGSLWLLDLAARKELPDVLKPDVASLLRNSPYKDLHNRALAAFPVTGKLDPKKLPGIAALARRRGNASRGQKDLATNKDLRCLACHTIHGNGGKVGPDLTVIGKKASRDNLFESILFPSKAVADQFQNWIVETKDGLELTGLIVEETPDHIILRDANSKDTRVATKAIEIRSKNPNSIMPSDLMGYMSEDELVDIVEYLFSLKEPSLSMDYWYLAGPFHGLDLDQELPPEKDVDLLANYSDKPGAQGWRKVKPNDKGIIDLQALLGKEGSQAVFYLYREVESPVGQPGELLLETENSAKVWMNGHLVRTKRDEGAPMGQDGLTPIKLQKGRNTLLIKIATRNQANGVFLLLQSDEDLKQVENKSP